MALNIDGRTHHLISYYSVADGMAGKFRAPSSLSDLMALGLSSDLVGSSSPSICFNVLMLTAVPW